MTQIILYPNGNKEKMKKVAIEIIVSKINVNTSNRYQLLSGISKFLTEYENLNNEWHSSAVTEVMHAVLEDEKKIKQKKGTVGQEGNLIHEFYEYICSEKILKKNVQMSILSLSQFITWLELQDNQPFCTEQVTAENIEKYQDFLYKKFAYYSKSIVHMKTKALHQLLSMLQQKNSIENTS